MGNVSPVTEEFVELEVLWEGKYKMVWSRTDDLGGKKSGGGGGGGVGTYIDIDIDIDIDIYIERDNKRRWGRRRNRGSAVEAK